jgi:hypothetical protein
MQASAMVTTFKMCITRAKGVMFNALPDGNKQLTLMDVIPIINKSFWTVMVT